MLRTPVTHADAREALEDVILLCGKVYADREEFGRVQMDDLLALRERIQDVRLFMRSGGMGYAAMPELVRPGDER